MAIFERDITAFYMTQIAQARDERGQVGIRGRCIEENHGEPRDFTLGLRVRRERGREKKDDREGDEPADQRAFD
jgi:hypothetical protein